MDTVDTRDAKNTCPYCGAHFDIRIPRTLNKTPQINRPEIVTLPYARDVDKFDPPSMQTNGTWTQVDKDFFAALHYDRLFGILKLPSGMIVYYCVARCPQCAPHTDTRRNRGLIDVFINAIK